MPMKELSNIQYNKYTAFLRQSTKQNSGKGDFLFLFLFFVASRPIIQTYTGVQRCIPKKERRGDKPCLDELNDGK